VLLLDEKRKAAILLVGAEKLARKFEGLEGTQGLVRAHFDMTTGDVSTGNVMAFLNYRTIKYVGERARSSESSPWMIHSVECEGNDASLEIKNMVRSEIVEIFYSLEKEKENRIMLKHQKAGNVVKDKRGLVLKGLDCMLTGDSVAGITRTGTNRVRICKEKATLGGSRTSDVSVEDEAFGDSQVVFCSKQEGNFLFRKMSWSTYILNKENVQVTIDRKEQKLDAHGIALESGDAINILKKIPGGVVWKKIFVINA